MIPRFRTLTRLITVVSIALGTSVAARAQTVDPDLQSRRGLHGHRLGGAGGWEDPGRRLLHDAGRRRDRHDAAQPYRPPQRRRLARPGFNPGANNAVYALAVQADGKILVAGCLHDVGRRGTGTTTRNRLARLNADGSLDTGFNPGANGQRRRVAVQADGKILVGGTFTTLGGGGTGTTARNYIGRLNADGSLDTGFNPGADSQSSAPWRCSRMGRSWSAASSRAGRRRDRHDAAQHASRGSMPTARSTPASIPGADSCVFNVAVQADGKMLVGGCFTMLGGGGTGTTARNYIGAAQRRRLARR